MGTGIRVFSALKLAYRRRRRGYSYLEAIEIHEL